MSDSADVSGLDDLSLVDAGVYRLPFRVDGAHVLVAVNDEGEYVDHTLARTDVELRIADRDLHELLNGEPDKESVG